MIPSQLTQHSAKLFDKVPHLKETPGTKREHGIYLLEGQAPISGIELPGHLTGGSQEAWGQMQDQ